MHNGVYRCALLATIVLAENPMFPTGTKTRALAHLYQLVKNKAEGACLNLHPAKAIDNLIAKCYPTYR